MTFLKKFRSGLALILAMTMVLGLCACGGSGDISTSEDSSSSQSTEDPISTPSEEPAQPSGLDQARNTIGPSGALGGIVFLGLTEDGTINDDLQASIESEGYMEEFPFLMKIDTEHLVNAGGYELYCIIPLDPMSKVKVVQWDDMNQTSGDTLYTSETGEPFLLLCNVSDLMPNSTLSIEDSHGNSLQEYMPSLSLKDGHIHLPDDPKLHLLDLSHYDDTIGAPYAFDLYLPDLQNGEVTVLYTQLDNLDGSTIFQFYIDHNLAPFESYLRGFSVDEKDLTLDFDASFVAYLNTLTEDQTDLLLECLANSYIMAFDAETVSYTAEGTELKTNATDYSELFEFTTF